MQAWKRSLTDPPRVEYDSWVYRVADRYKMPVSRIELMPSEMECEIGLMLGEVVVQQAQDIASKKGLEWATAMRKLRESNDWLDKLIFEKCKQMEKQKAGK